jgi:hypothetical protein
MNCTLALAGFGHISDAALLRLRFKHAALGFESRRLRKPPGAGSWGATIPKLIMASLHQTWGKWSGSGFESGPEVPKPDWNVSMGHRGLFLDNRAPELEALRQRIREFEVREVVFVDSTGKEHRSKHTAVWPAPNYPGIERPAPPRRSSSE